MCDLSAAPHLGLAATTMLRKLHATLVAQGIRLALVGAHGGVTDLLRRDGLADQIGGIERDATLEAVVAAGMEGWGHARGASGAGSQALGITACKLSST